MIWLTGSDSFLIINDVLVDDFIFDTSTADGAFSTVFSGILNSHLKNATAQVEPAKKAQSNSTNGENK